VETPNARGCELDYACRLLTSNIFGRGFDSRRLHHLNFHVHRLRSGFRQQARISLTPAEPLKFGGGGSTTSGPGKKSGALLPKRAIPIEG
jgi:hypothetical protein